MRTKILGIVLVAAAWFFMPGQALALTPTPDRLIKGGLDTVYYYADNGKRYVFPNRGTYLSWFSDFSVVVEVSAADLAAIPLGGNVTYRPGIKLIKVQTDPKVYAVETGGVLRWIDSESVAAELYGANWNQAIDDISDAFFVNYSVGQKIDRGSDFAPALAAIANDTINADKSISVSLAPQRSSSEVANVVDSWRIFALEDINRLRKEHGKGPMIMSNLLNRIANIHSQDMAANDNFAHNGSLGETADQRIRNGKIPNLSTGNFMIVDHPTRIHWSGENLGQATMQSQSDTAEEAIAKIHGVFMDEPADEPNHRTTMLSTIYPFSEVGIGIAIDAKNRLWLTEDYLSR